MNNQTTDTREADFRWSWLYNVSAAAALIVGILLLIALISLITAALQPGATTGWLSTFQNNWLIVILKIHAGFPGVNTDLLGVLDRLDIAILALVATVFLGLYAALRKTSKIWSLVALVQPFLGLVLFMVTKNAGRSGVMGACLVISAVMLRSSIFKKATAYIGILASVLLLAGDFSAGVIPPLTVSAALFAIGYVLLVLWFFLVALRLFQLGRKA